jgi:hypothetical protein
MARRRSTAQKNITIPQVIRDVLIASMNKGQFPLALLALIILAFLFKMPPNDVSQLAFAILENIVNGSLLGYLLGGGTTIGWFIHSKWQRRVLHEEIERLSLERNELQQKLLTDNIRSSE